MSASEGTSQKSNFMKAVQSHLADEDQTDALGDYNLNGKRASAPILEETEMENDSKMQSRVNR